MENRKQPGRGFGLINQDVKTFVSHATNPCTSSGVWWQKPLQLKSHLNLKFLYTPRY